MKTNYFALGILMAFISCLTNVSSQRQRCFGGYCSGQFGDMKAICKGGYCYCTGQDYDYNTCLPDAYGCRIEVNSNKALAKPEYNNQQPHTVYSCTPGSSSAQYEVHVLAVYEVINRRPPSAGDATVNIVSPVKSNRSIILVLASYEPVNWILNLPVNITACKAILVSYYVQKSSVGGDVSQVKVVEKKSTRNSQWRWGYGSDSGGGDTVELLKQVHNMFGVVTSFTGTYRADKFTLTLSYSHGFGYTRAVVTTCPPPAIPTPTIRPSLHRQRCHFNYCPASFKMSAGCRDGYCVCAGQGYDYNTCLPHAYGCRIEVNSNKALAKPEYNNQKPHTIYSCSPGSSSAQYEVHVLAVYEVINRRPPSAGDATVNIVSRGKSNRPIILVLANYEPVNWIINLPTNGAISKVILVSYYVQKSSVGGDVNRVQVVEKKGTRNSQWSRGYGSDSGGGDTVGLLKEVYNTFGAVASFTGTYRADKWTLMVSSSHVIGTRAPGSTDIWKNRVKDRDKENKSKDNKKSGLSGGAITGIVVGVLAVIGLVIIFTFAVKFCKKERRTRMTASNAPVPPEHVPTPSSVVHNPPPPPYAVSYAPETGMSMQPTSIPPPPYESLPPSYYEAQLSAPPYNPYYKGSLRYK